MANETTMNPASTGEGPDDTGRRRFLTATTAVVGAVGVGFAAVPFIRSWSPSERARQAGAPIKVDISALQEAQQLTVAWRGKRVIDPTPAESLTQIYERMGIGPIPSWVVLVSMIALIVAATAALLSPHAKRAASDEIRGLEGELDHWKF